MQLAFAITAAYVQKLRTGEGQEIEISMQEAMTYYMRTYVAQTDDWGETAVPRSGNSFGRGPTNLYPCKPVDDSDGANDYVYIIVITSRMWDVMCTAMERTDLLVDPRFADEADRIEHVAELQEEIRSWTMQRTKWEAMDILGKAGVPCSATHDTRDLFHNPHFEARGFIEHLQHPQWGSIPPARLGPAALPLASADAGRPAAGRAHRRSPGRRPRRPRRGPGRARTRGRRRNPMIEPAPAAFGRR